MIQTPARPARPAPATRPRFLAEFVDASDRRRLMLVIGAVPRAKKRAAQTLSLFGTVVVTAIYIATFGQATEAVGVELTELATIAGSGLFILDRCARADASRWDGGSCGDVADGGAPRDVKPIDSVVAA